MESEFPASWSQLEHPWVRRELLAYLDDLSAADPVATWAEERRNGLISGFGQVIDYLFEDLTAYDNPVGFWALDEDEVRLIASLREPLAIINGDLSAYADEEAVAHPVWGDVRECASKARNVLGSR